ncbi:MAG TPA: S8 family serine peptidase, partial [Solirubrobacteraceae bacterium]|nr:S8 family serine peptidase [Solirubrobacteraceae bacterium]
AGLAAVLRRLPGVRSVDVERRATLRLMPNDPALTAPETTLGTPSGTTVAWWVPRIGLPAAWDVARGDGATVAVIDTGADAAHPDLGGKIAAAVDNDDIAGHGPATSDENGHGTHVASLACAAGDNGFGSVGSGLNCRLLIFKTDLSDGSIARSIVQAADRGADAINMSFGSRDARAPRAIVEAIDYAHAKGAVLVAAADDRPVDEQGYPSNVLQPSGTGADLAAGRGLTVTAANFAGRRASFAGRGSQISLAAPGAFEGGGPTGIFAAFPGNLTELEAGGSLLIPGRDCRCRTTLGGDARFAYLQGTSMAAPIVAGVAAMARRLNPDATVADVIRVLKETATRPTGGGWNAELGWGIVDAGAAMNAVRAIDRRAPSSELKGRKRVRKARSVTLKWTGSDTAPAGLQPSGIDVYEVYRSTNRGPYRRVKRTRKSSLKIKVNPGSLYRFYTRAVDKAGNREAVPKRPDLSMRTDRRR